MNRSRVVLCLALTLGTIGVAATSPAPAPAELSRSVYISAADAKGAPVTDLTAAEVTVKEGGKERTVASLAPATGPMQVTIIVDDLGSGGYQRAVAQFAQATQGHAEISIRLLMPQARTILEPTQDVNAIQAGVDKLGARGKVQPDEEQVIAGVFEAAKAFSQRKAERPVILVLTVTGENPTSQYADSTLSALAAAGATLNVLLPANTSIGKVLGDGPKQFGGMSQPFAGDISILPGLAKIVDRLMHQYRLTYTLPDGVKPSDQLTVATTRKGLTLHAPKRIPK